MIANDEIYSSEYKTKFLDGLSDNELRSFELFFKLIRKYEVFYNKDILYFSRNQLSAMFEDLESTASTFEQRYRFLEKYYEGFAKKIPDIDFAELDVYESVRRGSLRDYKEFLYVINNSFRPDDCMTLDIIRKSCVILLYLGISKSEITNVLKSDVDEVTRTIKFRDSGITRQNIPVEIMNVLLICKGMTSYCVSNTKNVSEPLKDLQQNEYLIRRDASIGDEEKCPVLFIDKIFKSDAFKTVDKELTPTRMIESGLYHWIVEKEPFDIKQFRGLLKEYFNRDVTKYQHYFQNYYSWKKAFNI